MRANMGKLVARTLSTGLFMWALVVSTALPAPGNDKVPTSSEKTLFELAVSADLDGAIGPGGFDRVQAMNRQLLARVNDCRSKVMDVGRKWATSRKLDVEFDNDTSRFGQLIIWAPDKALGFYELVYRVDAARQEAILSFKFYDREARVMPVGGAEFADLKAKLLGAMSCSA